MQLINQQTESIEQRIKFNVFEPSKTKNSDQAPHTPPNLEHDMCWVCMITPKNIIISNI